MFLYARDENDCFNCAVNSDNIKLLYTHGFDYCYAVYADVSVLEGYDISGNRIESKIRVSIYNGDSPYFDTEKEAEDFLIGLIAMINGGN